LADTEEENPDYEVRYRDRSNVKIAGIVSAIRKKDVKNGDKMAFLRIDDKNGEIEVIVFAKQYAAFSSLLTEEAGVLISGTLSVEEGEGESNQVRVLLATVSLLESADEKASKSSKGELNDSPMQVKRICIKLASLPDKRTDVLWRLSSLNPGSAEVLLYDASSKRYVRVQGLCMSASDKVKARLCGLFGDENVVFLS
jgi:DNA polymerase-3 subunit alpha